MISVWFKLLQISNVRFLCVICFPQIFYFSTSITLFSPPLSYLPTSYSTILLHLFLIILIPHTLYYILSYPFLFSISLTLLGEEGSSAHFPEWYSDCYETMAR